MFLELRINIPQNNNIKLTTQYMNSHKAKRLTVWQHILKVNAAKKAIDYNEILQKVELVNIKMASKNSSNRSSPKNSKHSNSSNNSFDDFCGKNAGIFWSNRNLAYDCWRHGKYLSASEVWRSSG